MLRTSAVRCMSTSQVTLRANGSMLLNGLADDSMHRAARICGVQSRRGADWLISVPHKTSRRNRSDSLYISPPKTTISYSLFVLSGLLILLSLLSQVNTFLIIFKYTTSRHIRFGRHRINYHNILYEYDAEKPRTSCQTGNCRFPTFNALAGGLV